MNLLAAFLAALRALSTNWLRSMLTMLGIIIGVAAVITMIAIGGGARQRVEEQIKALGTNIMLVLPGAMTSGGVRLGAQTGQTQPPWMGRPAMNWRSCCATAYPSGGPWAPRAVGS